MLYDFDQVINVTFPLHKEPNFPLILVDQDSDTDQCMYPQFLNGFHLSFFLLTGVLPYRPGVYLVTRQDVL